MPKRDDIRTILIIGSGPITIGQACEFDYSGTQACKALREEGYQVVLVNSNPATIMTDPQFSDRTYIEPITPEAITKVIEREANGPYHVDALLPTLGGQTALNAACALFDAGTLEKHGVAMIGANRDVIYRAEDRKQFAAVIEELGLRCPRAATASSLEEAWGVLDGDAAMGRPVGLPAIIRPAFTLGGTGGGIAYNREEFEEIVRRGLDASMTGQVLIDESLIGWKEFELELMRDRDDNVVVICSIENFDPMGVHTGDSITVAPAQTLTDKEYQYMRDAAIAIIRAIGVETGGSNIQFAVDPHNGEMVVIEMNPRVSRSSALASKATGFPIARIAAKLAAGYTLWELPNDITGRTVACFEPTIDYVVTKIPRWTFEKFPEADETLTTQMKSVGEGMAIGRTFKESLQKGVRSMEIKRFGLGLDAQDAWLAHQEGEEAEFPVGDTKLTRKLSVPAQGRLFYIRYALRMGWSLEHVAQLTKIDPWFLEQIRQIVAFEDRLRACPDLDAANAGLLFEAKQLGFADAQLARLWLGRSDNAATLRVRARRRELGIEAVYKIVDTCAAEFEAETPYYYASYEAPITRVDAGEPSARAEDEIRVSERPKVVILGGGPNRIGQGIEFDYCCVQAAFALRELGYESVMINSNPETVSTDYDTSDLLFFEPLTLEDVLNVCERLNGGPFGEGEDRVAGVLVQLGGQTPLNLAHGLEAAGVPIIGTPVDSIDLAEDRQRFSELLGRHPALVQAELKQPAHGIAYSVDEAEAVAKRIGYPVLVRPSFVLGGRAMETVYDDEQLQRFMTTAIGASDLEDQPILIDQFLADALECDVDVVADFGAVRADETPRAVVGGVMEHIEEAGIHSGDSACAVPAHSLPRSVVARVEDQARRLAEALHVRGLMNVQFAVRRPQEGRDDYEIFVLEVNPRASRTVPFVSKATGKPWAFIAAKAMGGASLAEQGVREAPTPAHTSVKESVFPFNKFPGVDVILGPEMRSTGEVMGADPRFPLAFAKAQMAAGTRLPREGTIFLSVREADKPHVVPIARELVACGFRLLTTGGTHAHLKEHGLETERINKISEGRPNAVDRIKNNELALIINTPTRKGIASDEGRIRATAVRFNVPMITTMTGASAAIQAIVALREGRWDVRAWQDYFP